MGIQLPSGKVTFLFTDVEGSTKLLHAVGAAAYAAALAEQRRVLRDAFGRHGGVEVDTQDSRLLTVPHARQHSARPNLQVDGVSLMAQRTGVR